MKTVITKIIYLTLIAAALGGAVSTVYAAEDPKDRDHVQWHLTEPDRSRFVDIESGNGSF